MMSSNHLCLIRSVGPITEKKGFKKCIVRLTTKELKDNDTGEIVRHSGTYDVDVPNITQDRHNDLVILSDLGESWVPCFIVHRSFEYVEKGQTKLGCSKELKRWWK